MASSMKINPETVPLNPEMVYRPLSPPLAHIGEDGEPLVKFRFSVLIVLRLMVVTLCIITFILNLYAQFHDDFTTAFFVLIWVVLIWNLIMAFPKRAMTGRSLPSLHCGLGVFRCFCECDSGSDDDANRRQPKKKAFVLSWAIDLGWGILLLILGIVSITGRPWWARGYNKALSTFIFLTAIGEIIVGLAFHIKIFRSLLIYVYPDDADEQPYRIRLSPDTDSAAHQPLSVAA